MVTGSSYNGPNRGMPTKSVTSTQSGAGNPTAARSASARTLRTSQPVLKVSATLLWIAPSGSIW